MPSLITGLTPTTELEAINAMLSSIGEAPITDLATATSSDVTVALNILRNVTRDLQSKPWHFNTEFGLELSPTGIVDWTDSSGTKTLNVFQPPKGLAAFEVSKCPEQQGSQYPDTTLRPSRKFGRIQGFFSTILEPFTSISTVALKDFVGFNGTRWSKIAGVADPNVQGNEIIFSAFENHVHNWQYVWPETSADIRVSCMARFSPTSGITEFVAVRARCPVLTDQRGYELRILQTGSCAMYSVDAAGAVTQIGTSFVIPGYVPTVARKIGLDCTGTTISMLIDDVVQRTVVNNTYAAKGYVGLTMRGGGPSISSYADTLELRIGGGITLAGPGVLVFYDRAKNRDGFDPAERTVLYIDAVWFFDFDLIPEAARRYAYVKAARAFQRQSKQVVEAHGFNEADEYEALLKLLNDQGDDDDYNMLDNYDVAGGLGDRARMSGVADLRRSPGHTPSLF